MGRPDGDTDDAELSRISRVYSDYRRSTLKQKAWSAENPGNIAIRTELVEAACHMAAAEVDGPGDVLDVGCGTGWWLEELIERGVAAGRLHGVELLPHRAAAARRRAPGSTVLEGDARALPFENDRFSVVTMFTVASSLSNRSNLAKALEELRRVTSPGGFVLVYEGRIVNPFNGNTMLVREADVYLAGFAREVRRDLTVLPPLVRKLGQVSERTYPRLARVPMLRTHYLLGLRHPSS